jgi:hypothetical protein
MEQLNDRVAVVALNFEDICLESAAGTEFRLQLFEKRISAFD